MTKRTLVVLLLALAAYGCVEAWPLAAGPSLTIDAPADQATLAHDGIVMVKGNAARAAELALDGTPITREENGDFSVTLTLPRGGSILTLTAADRFGRQVTATRSVFVP